MGKVTYVGADGTKSEIDVPEGENLMHGALYNGVEGIIGECGGGLTCATCHCYVDEAWAGKTGGAGEMESELLESAGASIKPTSRLSCQIEMSDALDGIIVHLPESQY